MPDRLGRGNRHPICCLGGTLCLQLPKPLRMSKDSRRICPRASLPWACGLPARLGRGGRRCALGLLLFGGLIFGCRSRNAYIPPPPPDVIVGVPEQRSVTLYHYYTGTTQASDSVEIRARVGQQECDPDRRVCSRLSPARRPDHRRGGPGGQKTVPANGSTGARQPTARLKIHNSGFHRHSVATSASCSRAIGPGGVARRGLNRKGLLRLSRKNTKGDGYYNKVCCVWSLLSSPAFKRCFLPWSLAAKAPPAYVPKMQPKSAPSGTV